MTRSIVGASLLAMVVNDNACGLVKRGAPGFIASRLALQVCGHDHERLSSLQSSLAGGTMRVFGAPLALC
ncbi:hypothetical protein F7R06_19590 [Pseudomonas moorei]|nr:hypothetical protein F7R06_19590 [Pseudomonas moorei]